MKKITVIKNCKACKKDKSLFDFELDKTRPDGYKIICKTCLARNNDN